MATTTPDKMYQAIITRIQAIGSPLVHDDYVYISPEPRFTQEDDQYIQIVPGVPSSITSQAGYFLIEEEFEVVVWSRSYIDQGGRSTARYADLTYGVLRVMTQVRTQLLNHFLSYDGSNTASMPLVYIRGSRLFESPEYPGWCYLSDTYQFGYEIA